MDKNSKLIDDQANSFGKTPDFSRRSVAGGFAGIAASLFAATKANAASGRDGGRGYIVGTDYATQDNPYYDPEFAPIHFPHIFKSKGDVVQSFMWLADGPEPKGCVVICSQAFGGDALDSVIPTLLGAGIHVMRFHPRGMWDDRQDYSFVGALEDLHSAVAHLTENGGQHMVPGGSRAYRIDPSRIAILGKSGGGGNVGWVAASENAAINSVVAVSPGEVKPGLFGPDRLKMYASQKEATDGRIDLLKWLRALTPADYERLDMRKAVPKLVDKRVMLIGCNERDYLSNIHHPLVALMEQGEARNFEHVIMDCNSYFLTARIALARTIASFLKTKAGF